MGSEGEALRETHIDRDGRLWIPPGLREFDQQVVFRTPRMTIQHFSSNPLDPYYGAIGAGDFGELDSPGNPELVPNRVSIKHAGEDPVVLEVGLDGE